MSDEYLRQAVQLAQRGQTSDAIQYAKRHVRQNMDDERGWYLLARLVRDERIKREALARVLQINPFHEKALALLNELDARSDSFVFDNVSLFDSEPSVQPADQDVFSEATYADQILPDADSNFFQVNQLPIATGHAAALPRKSANGGVTEFLIGVGVLLFAVLFAVGVGYYAYAYQHRGILGLFGPDLTQVADTGAFSLHYPSGWQGIMNEGGLVAVNTDLNQLGTGEVEALTADVLLADDQLFLRAYGEAGLQLLIMTPVTPEVLASLQVSGLPPYTSARDYVERTIPEMETFQSGELFEVELTDRRIGGESGVLGITEVNAAELDLFLSLYIGAVSHNGQEYLFMYMAVGNQDQNHKRLVGRILNSVSFAG